jgi:hypothetical protein
VRTASVGLLPAGPGAASVYYERHDILFPPRDPVEDPVRVYATDDPFPHAWMVHIVEATTNEEAACAPLFFMP